MGTRLDSDVNNLMSTLRLSLLSFFLLLAGCGGGSSSGSDGHSNEASATVVSGDSLAATVVIEERSGKTVIDAWFAYAAVDQNAIDMMSHDGSADVCRMRVSVASGGIPATTRVATMVKIVSRAETVATLEAFEGGSVAHYTTDERWLDDPIPDDAMLTFSEDDVLLGVGVIALPKLEPLQWTAPTSGLLASNQDSLQWDAGEVGDSRIQINFSSVSQSDTAEAPVLIQCDLVDDGEFNLDAESLRALGGNNANIVFRAQRQRSRLFGAEGESVTVTQISHASI